MPLTHAIGTAARPRALDGLRTLYDTQVRLRVALLWRRVQDVRQSGNLGPSTCNLGGERVDVAGSTRGVQMQVEGIG